MGSRASRYRDLLTNSWRVFRSSGLWSLSTYFLQWAGLYRCLRVYCHPSCVERESARIPIEIGELREDELGDYASLVPDSDLDDIRRRMAQGDVCTTARLPSGSRELIGVRWTALGRAWVGFVECEIELDSRAAYGYDQFVSSKHRGAAIAGALESYRDVELREQGVDLSVYTVWSENTVSLRRIDQRAPAGSESGVLHSYRILHWHWNRLELYPSKYRPLLRLVSNPGR